MPATKKITGDAVLAAALDVIREGGFSAVNARSVAQKLGCSTQPIYLCFENMQELRLALRECAKAEHLKRVKASISKNNGSHSHYCDYGVGFVRFAEQEKELFKWIYLEENIGKEQYDMFAADITKTISEEYGYSADVAKQLHKYMTFFTYGIAVLANTGKLQISEAELEKMFKNEFLALTSIFGAPPNEKN